MLSYMFCIPSYACYFICIKKKYKKKKSEIVDIYLLFALLLLLIIINIAKYIYHN